MPRLAEPEVRRLLEGRRVDAEIERMVTETMDAADGDARKARRQLGRVAPRESDERLLREYAEKMDRGEVTSAAGRAK